MVITYFDDSHRRYAMPVYSSIFEARHGIMIRSQYQPVTAMQGD